MGTLVDDINSQIDAGRKTIHRSLDEIHNQVPVNQVPRPVVVATGLAAIVMAVGVGWMIYRSRRRRTLVQKLQDALPETVRDLPEDLRSKARRPLERAFKAF